MHTEEIILWYIGMFLQFAKCIISMAEKYFKSVNKIIQGKKGYSFG